MRLAVKLLGLLSLAALLGGCGLIVDRRADRREASAMAEFPPEGQILSIDGTRVHAVVAGRGPDLVLIHGAGGNTRDMTFSLAPALTDRYRVIAIDRPGFGYTDPLPDGGTIFEQAALLQKAAAQLGADRPIVMGHSYGGAVALAWAVSRPGTLSALVPVSAASQVWDGGIGPFYKITGSALGGATVVPLITAFASEQQVEDALVGVFAPQPVPEGYSDAFGPGLTLRRVSLRANGEQRVTLKAEIAAMVPLYPQIDIPVEIVHGTADTTVGLEIHARPTARAIPGATLTELPGIGHMTQHVSVPAVTAAIDRVAARAGF